MDLHQQYPLYLDWLNIFLRYFLLASVLHLVFYVFGNKKIATLKIQPNGKSLIETEILYSISTLCIQCLTSLGVYAAARSNLTTFYSDIAEYGWPYFIFTVILMIFMHDAYFYWTHRLLHVRGILGRAHAVHHRSKSPTPWTAFSFHPLEAVISVGIIPFCVFIFPVHPFAVLIFLFWMTLINVMGHSGFEVFSKRFTNSVFGRFHNSASRHDLHHEKGNYNFGLYFTFWDRLMKTYRDPDPR